MAVITYYFDASDAAATDPGPVWTGDDNAFDGDITTSATSSTSGSNAANFLKAEGTNAADLGTSINFIRARSYSVTNSNQFDAEIYTDALGETLGKVIGSSIIGWMPYVDLVTPSGGWTWVKVQALEVKIWKSGGGGTAAGCARVELLINHNSPNKPGNYSRNIIVGNDMSRSESAR